MSSPAGTAKMLRHEMDLKVAELTLNGVAKDSVEALGGTRFSSFRGWVLSFVVRLMLSSPDSRPRIYAWTAELLVCWSAVRRRANQKTRRPENHRIYIGLQSGLIALPLLPRLSTGLVLPLSPDQRTVGVGSTSSSSRCSAPCGQYGRRRCS